MQAVVPARYQSQGWNSWEGCHTTTAAALCVGHFDHPPYLGLTLSQRNFNKIFFRSLLQRVLTQYPRQVEVIFSVLLVRLPVAQDMLAVWIVS